MKEIKMLIRKRFKFEMAHRLVSSYSTRCQSIHGHSYTVDVTLRDEELNEDEMVVDFGKVKDEMNEFMDQFDHTMVLASHDPIKDEMIAMMKSMYMRYMVVNYNPTAERMAEHIYQEFVGRGYKMDSVRVDETLTGYAICTELNFKKKLAIVDIGGM